MAAATSPLDFDAPFSPSEVADAESADPASTEGGLFYGWLMVALTTLVLVGTSPGQTFGFTYFNPRLREALGLSQTQLSATYLLATLLAAVPLSYVGGLADRMGLKRSMLAAVGAMAGSCLLAASVQNVPMLFAACVAMRLFGPGVMTLLSNNTLAAWFDRRLGEASGAVQVSMAAAIALVPIGLMALIAAVGWREAYVFWGIALLVGVAPLVWWGYREDPCEVGQVRDGWRAESAPHRGRRNWRLELTVPDDDAAYDLRGAMRTRAFWILMTATSVWSMIGTGLVFHLESLLSSRGMSASDAAWATPVMAFCMALTQLLAGRLADRTAPGRLATIALLLMAGSCITFAVGQGLALIGAYAIYGIGAGVTSLVTTTVWARFYGRVHLGRIRGTALTAAISASAVGPLVMGASVDFLGGFEPSMWIFAAGACLSALVSPLATRPAALRADHSDDDGAPSELAAPTPSFRTRRQAAA
jgi:OFA family oxalate/formate antiporter-like MFS transporter